MVIYTLKVNFMVIEHCRIFLEKKLLCFIINFKILDNINFSFVLLSFI